MCWLAAREQKDLLHTNVRLKEVTLTVSSTEGRCQLRTTTRVLVFASLHSACCIAIAIHVTASCISSNNIETNKNTEKKRKH
jgi:hypothetical protein